ncbi:2',3'-cyclic-nucleotide 3'-phosphodiesterase [Mucidula mucida]|nr:2',3'-cyclic-nucleotide 3'-phosphodiesterase [Mucidula mucida]
MALDEQYLRESSTVLLGVTLWIVPSRKDAEKLKHIMDIRPASSARTSEASYPSFEPHITLLSLPADSSISLQELRASIPKSTPLKISFNSVNIGDHFFRSVYIAVKPTPELWSLHAHTHKALNQEPRTPLFPHISLSLNDAGRIKSIEDGDGVALNCSQGAGEDWMSTFETSEIWIAECNGPVESWKILDKVSLS